MRLSILSVAFPFAPVGSDSVGGAERILSDLDRALVAEGHDSLVIACEGSEAAGRLFAASPGDFQQAIGRVLASNRVDLIHVHAFNFHQFEWPTEIPVLVTLHLPISWYPNDVWRRYGPNVVFQCVSEAQRRTAPPELAAARVVPNGVTLPTMEPECRRNFALTLGRICPEKNQHSALEAGTLAGIRVLLGGQVFPWPEHSAYFAEKIVPLLSSHEFLGPLSKMRTWRLLLRAKCLLHPTLAPETSSLVAMEALAAGTPVIAYPSGALPEIIDHGVTGFLVRDVSEMADAISRVCTISSDECRRQAERRFSGACMTRAFLKLYCDLIRQPEALHAAAS